MSVHVHLTKQGSSLYLSDLSKMVADHSLKTIEAALSTLSHANHSIKGCFWRWKA